MGLIILILIAFAIMQDVSAHPAKGNPYKSEHCIRMTPQKEQEINNIITRITDFLGNITNEFEDFDIRLIKLDIESHSEDEVEEKDVKLQLTVNDCAEDKDEKEDEELKSGKEEEKDISIEIPDETYKEKPMPIETTSQIPASTDKISVENVTEGNDTKGCEKCPCVCSTVKQNVESPTRNKKYDDNNTDKNELNSSKIESIVKNYRDTNVNEENQSSAEITSHYDVTPVDTIRFYDFGKDTDSNNEGGYKQVEITKIYTFSNVVRPEVVTLDLSGVEAGVLDVIEKKRKPLLVYIQRIDDKNEYIFVM